MKREKSLAKASAWQDPDGFIVERFNAARTGVETSMRDMTAFAELEPRKALLWAVGAGYVLRMLPTTRIFAVLVRMLLALLKPAALFYGVAKITQIALPVASRRSRENP